MPNYVPKRTEGRIKRPGVSTARLGVILSMLLCINNSEKLKKITPKNLPLVTIDSHFLVLQ